jgi:hypothetical protein
MALKALYGVAGLGPVQLVRYLTRVNGGTALVSGNKVHKTGPLPEVPSVVFANLSQFLKHNARITKDHIAFVVDAPENLETVSGLLGLGYARLKDGHYSYTMLRDDELILCLKEARAKAQVAWSYTPVNRIKALLHDDKTDAVVNKLRSALYAVPDKEVRKEITTLVFRYLANQVPLAKVNQGAISRLPVKAQARIQTLLKSSDCRLVKEAYAKYRARPNKAVKICKAYKVSMFTLRYLEVKTNAAPTKRKVTRH